jgi:hypothetical protein
MTPPAHWPPAPPAAPHLPMQKREKMTPSRSSAPHAAVLLLAVRLLAWLLRGRRH